MITTTMAITTMMPARFHDADRGLHAEIRIHMT
jgi:hypothetical protein